MSTFFSNLCNFRLGLIQSITVPDTKPVQETKSPIKLPNLRQTGPLVTNPSEVTTAHARVTKLNHANPNSFIASILINAHEHPHLDIVFSRTLTPEEEEDLRQAIGRVYTKMSCGGHICLLRHA